MPGDIEVKPFVLENSRLETVNIRERQRQYPAGLDYPGVGPELAGLYTNGRVTLTYATDAEAVSAVDYFAKLEGVISALESAHALAEVRKIAPTMPKDAIVVATLSGRGDKDLFNFARAFKDESFRDFLKDEYNRYE